MRETFSVAICCYTEQRWDQLVAAIESVRAQRLAPLELLVSVDHNADLEQRLRSTFSDAVVLANRHAPGLSGARNSALQAARGSVVAFLDDDATADGNWLAELESCFANPSVLGVGGRVLPLWGAAGRPAGLPPQFDWVVGCTYQEAPDMPATIRNPIGANMAIRRSVFERVGGFRTSIGRVGTRPMGCEETELAIRATQRLGGRFVYCPTAIVHHHVGASRRGWRYFLSRCYAEGASKATVARLVGSADGLSAERSHIRRVLLPALLQDGARLLRLDADAGRRILRNVAGTSAAAAGYAIHRFLRPPPSEPALATEFLAP